MPQPHNSSTLGSVHSILGILLLLLQGDTGRSHVPKELGHVGSAIAKEEVPAPAGGTVGSLLNLVRESLARVLEAWTLKEAMLVVVLGRATPRAAGRLPLVEAMKIATGRVVARQELSHRSSELSW